DCMSTQEQKLNTLCLKVDVDQILNLRHKILRPGLPIEKAVFEGDKNPAPVTYHFGCFILKAGPAPLSCVTYNRVDYEGMPAYQLRGMATRVDYQGKKLGSILMTSAQKIISRETGINVYWCNARVEAIP